MEGGNRCCAGMKGERRENEEEGCRPFMCRGKRQRRRKAFVHRDDPLHYRVQRRNIGTIGEGSMRRRKRLRRNQPPVQWIVEEALREE